MDATKQAITDVLIAHTSLPYLQQKVLAEMINDAVRDAQGGDTLEALPAEPTPDQQIRMWAVEQIGMRDWSMDTTDTGKLIALATPLAHWAGKLIALATPLAHWAETGAVPPAPTPGYDNSAKPVGTDREVALATEAELERHSAFTWCKRALAAEAELERIRSTDEPVRTVAEAIAAGDITAAEVKAAPVMHRPEHRPGIGQTIRRTPVPGGHISTITIASGGGVRYETARVWDDPDMDITGVTRADTLDAATEAHDAAVAAAALGEIGPAGEPQHLTGEAAPADITVTAPATGGVMPAVPLVDPQPCDCFAPLADLSHLFMPTTRGVSITANTETGEVTTT